MSTIRAVPAAMLATVVLAGLLAGCAPLPVEPVGLVEVIARPAERTLLAGLRAYDDAQYAEAEKQLSRALGAGLASPKDRAAAHKHLAFIYCTSSRTSDCERAFRAAAAADPGFELSKSESGHPLWGQIYQRTRQ